MYVRTASPLPFGAELVVHLLLPGQKAPFALPGVVRWTRAGEGMGVQFGLIGARETHAITELTSRAP
jgi:type IV pilus assembly protein PilZ